MHFTANEHQPWTNYENNGNQYLVIRAVVCSEYSNVQYQHLIIGSHVQNFVWNHKNGSKSRNHVTTASSNLPYFTP